MKPESEAEGLPSGRPLASDVAFADRAEELLAGFGDR
jgi:hypothetical protein